MQSVLLVAVLVLASVGCASDDRTYYWSSYQDDLYKAYKSPKGRADDFEETLLRIIEKSDQSGRKTPPGVLAEYGYFLYQRGEFDSAIHYFEREAREWPESAVLMETMIRQAREGSES
jgi:hypothetical protein